MSYRAHRLEGAVQPLRIHAVRHISHRLGRERKDLVLHCRLKDNVPCRRVVVAASAKPHMGGGWGRVEWG